MKCMPFGVSNPKTLSQPGPVARDESVPNAKTSQRVDEELWNNALTDRASFVAANGVALEEESGRTAKPRNVAFMRGEKAWRLSFQGGLLQLGFNDG